MAEEKKELSESDKMGLLALSARSLEDYFTSLKYGKTENAIDSESKLDEKTSPRALSSLIKDITYCFLGDENTDHWGSVVYLGTIDDSKKYALRALGKRIPNKGAKTSEEDRAFAYVRSHLSYIKIARKGEKKQKEEACDKLIRFFGGLAKIAEKEIKWD